MCCTHSQSTLAAHTLTSSSASNWRRSCSWRSPSTQARACRQLPDHSPLQHVSPSGTFQHGSQIYRQGRRGRATALSAVGRGAEGERRLHLCVGNVSCPCVWCHVLSCITLRLILSDTFDCIINLSVIQVETCMCTVTITHK